MFQKGMTAEQEMAYWLNWTPETETDTASHEPQEPPQTAAEPADSTEHTKLRAAGFLVTPDGEAEARLGALSSVILERDGEQWHAYRVRWYPEIGRMQTYRTLHKGPYAVAVRKACEMAEWMARKRKDDEK